MEPEGGRFQNVDRQVGSSRYRPSSVQPECTGRELLPKSQGQVSGSRRLRSYLEVPSSIWVPSNTVTCEDPSEDPGRSGPDYLSSSSKAEEELVPPHRRTEGGRSSLSSSIRRPSLPGPLLSSGTTEVQAGSLAIEAQGMETTSWWLSWKAPRNRINGKIVPLTSVVTPTMTPVASPVRANTPISLISEDHEEQSSIKSPRPNAWSNTELPLEEENPHSLKEAVLYKDAVVMTVAEEEEPKSLISVTSPETQKPIVLSKRELTPPPSSSSSSTSTEESSTVTESDTPDKPLSEGEVLYSDGQIIVPRGCAHTSNHSSLAAAFSLNSGNFRFRYPIRGKYRNSVSEFRYRKYRPIPDSCDLAAGGLVFPNLMESFSSTLKDANDMEFDPPSEGQIMDRGARHDPVRLLLAKLSQDSVARQEVFYHPESSGDENSMGEISEGQRPCLTPAAEQILVGHSAFMDRGATGQTAGHLRRHQSPHGPQMNIPGYIH
ncbi:unnamed protein product [Ranitomeya imitator]|uniref:Uncharacterized protein n=1 Tax=Ranitomeya imitator TaxID=111125 RepID=A0ABN9L6H1_9NEOB|nr:unnamed protein product [Ranitomeya imitator]